MNKKISTSLSISLIVVLALLVSVYTITKSRNAASVASNQSIAMERPSQKSTDCKVHAFQGSTEVSVWQITKNGKTFLQVAKEDAPKLPMKDVEDFQLIDPTPEIEKKIASSSEKEPIKLSISGFISLCDGTNLVCTSYQDKIFSPYITN